MTAINPSKKSRTPMISISQPAKPIQPAQALLRAMVRSLLVSSGAPVRASAHRCRRSSARFQGILLSPSGRARDPEPFGLLLARARGGPTALKQKPPSLGDRDDRESDDDADEPLMEAEMHGAEDPLEDAELGPEQDRR